MRGTHKSALAEEAIAHFSADAKQKGASNQARLVCYKKIISDLPTKMKVSPIAAIPHKSNGFRSILDLSFSRKLISHGRVPSVNKNSEKTAPGGTMDQIGHVLLHLIMHSLKHQTVQIFSKQSGISRIVFGGYIVKKGKNGFFVMSYHRSHTCQ